MTLPKGELQPKNAVRTRIAVVYHEQEFVDFLAEVIRGEGYEVDGFTDTLLALEKIGLQHSTYSVAVIGWRNPRLDGVGLAMELYKIDPGIEIILFSAFDLANRALEHIARTYNVKFDHLSQPFEMSVLLKAINNKVKNGKSDESDFIRRHTLPPESKEDYRKTNDTNWKQRFIWPWGMGVAIGAIILCITLLAWLATLD